MTAKGEIQGQDGYGRARAQDFAFIPRDELNTVPGLSEEIEQSIPAPPSQKTPWWKQQGPVEEVKEPEPSMADEIILFPDDATNLEIGVNTTERLKTTDSVPPKLSWIDRQKIKKEAERARKLRSKGIDTTLQDPLF